MVEIQTIVVRDSLSTAFFWIIWSDLLVSDQLTSHHHFLVDFDGRGCCLNIWKEYCCSDVERLKRNN